MTPRRRHGSSGRAISCKAACVGRAPRFESAFSLSTQVPGRRFGRAGTIGISGTCLPCRTRSRVASSRASSLSSVAGNSIARCVSIRRVSTAGITRSAPCHAFTERCRTSTHSPGRMPSRPATCCKRRSTLTLSRLMRIRCWRCHTSMTPWRTGQKIRRAPSRRHCEAAHRAVELDDEDWLSHALFGIALLWTSRNHDRALEEVERAIALNPSAAIAYQFLGCVALFAGRPTQAVPALETVLHLDPQYQSRSLILADLSLARLLLGDVDDAVAAATDAVQREPENVRAHHRLVAALGHTGREAEARAALKTLLHLQPDFSDAYVRATYPFRFAEHLALFNDGFRRAGWKGK